MCRIHSAIGNWGLVFRNLELFAFSDMQVFLVCKSTQGPLFPERQSGCLLDVRSRRQASPLLVAERVWKMSGWLTDAWLGFPPKYVFNADNAQIQLFTVRERVRGMEICCYAKKGDGLRITAY